MPFENLEEVGFELGAPYLYHVYFLFEFIRLGRERNACSLYGAEGLAGGVLVGEGAIGFVLVDLIDLFVGERRGLSGSRLG